MLDKGEAMVGISSCGCFLCMFVIVVVAVVVVSNASVAVVRNC